MRAHKVASWRISPEIRAAVAEYARQTRRSQVGAAEVLLQAALDAAAERGEWLPPRESE